MSSLRFHDIAKTCQASSAEPRGVHLRIKLPHEKIARRQCLDTHTMASIDAVIDGGIPESSHNRAIHEDDDPADGFDALNIREDSEGWSDAEDDAEELEVKCLLCEDITPSVASMVDHCRTGHGFDLLATQKKHGG